MFFSRGAKRKPGDADSRRAGYFADRGGDANDTGCGPLRRIYHAQRHHGPVPRQWLPSLSDWDSYDNWEVKGTEDVARSARRKCQEMLAEAPESLIEPDLDAALQAYI